MRDRRQRLRQNNLIRDGLLPALLDKLGGTPLDARLAKLTGWQSIDSVMMVDQSSLGRTPRSNPAVYVHAFDDIRKLFAASPEAKALEFPGPGAFSFNSARGPNAATAVALVLRKSKCSS
ncbi:MAG: hypothetical protein Ct9H300mP7_3980 [Verrucomicrobiota bacterium]|nr:MAG: hypothetical protein Ct9H300mP7_3980 [Verrucomicrobiota bacterium]